MPNDFWRRYALSDKPIEFKGALENEENRTLLAHLAERRQPNNDRRKGGGVPAIHEGRKFSIFPGDTPEKIRDRLQRIASELPKEEVDKDLRVRDRRHLEDRRQEPPPTG